MSLAAPKPARTDGSTLKVGIAAARYNGKFVGALLAQATAALSEAGVKEAAISIVRVPGSGELPIAIQILARRKRPDVLLALGVIVRGGTIHYELLAGTVAQGLQAVALSTGIPVINGVVVVENAAQAAARCTGRIRRGGEFAAAALEMAALGRTR
jgi:6,7-dimethyl-8-ribityllumazine synthase